MIDLSTYGLYLAAALFAVGLVVILTKRNIIFVLVGTELILNAANLNLVIFSQSDPNLQGQLFAVFSIVIAAAEVAVALALLLNIFKYLKTSNLNDLNQLGH